MKRLLIGIAFVAIIFTTQAFAMPACPNGTPGRALAEAARFLGLPNLQVVNRDAHATKSSLEARDRRVARSLETELG
jgi:hypothetical protein